MTKITRKIKSTSYNTLTCFFDQGGKHLNETPIHFVIFTVDSNLKRILFRRHGKRF